MKVFRGDIVLVDLPFFSGGGSKVRPSLVVQNNRDNQRLGNVILAMISSRIDRAASEPTQLLIDLATAEGAQSRLLTNSAVNCSNLFTLDKTLLIRRIGSLPPVLMDKINTCLRAAFDLS